LAGGIAHDFNNILQSVLSYAQLGQKKCPKTTAYTDTYRGSRERMSALPI